MLIPITETYLLLDYIITIIVAIIVALMIKLPLLPENPIRQSWTQSALFPTPIIAVGLVSICIQLNITGYYLGIDLAIIIGILTALFVKYLLDDTFPKPKNEEIL